MSNGVMGLQRNKKRAAGGGAFRWVVETHNCVSLLLLLLKLSGA